MKRFDIRVRRNQFTQSRIERHKNYQSLLEKHYEQSRKKTRGVMVLVFVLIIVLAILLAVFHNPDKDANENTDQQNSELKVNHKTKEYCEQVYRL